MAPPRSHDGNLSRTERTMSTQPSDTMAAGTRAGKYLTFFLAGEEYGVAILKVSEIVGPQPITRVPGVPDFVRGVINLRGKVIPITDLRRKFSMTREATQDGCIVVVAMQGVVTGIVADRVGDVVTITEPDIEDAPSFGAGIHTGFLLGISKAGGRVRMLLDIDRVLSVGEMELLELAHAPDA
jgi:purine-binding chemotaxis protein CheW